MHGVAAVITLVYYVLQIHLAGSFVVFDIPVSGWEQL